MTVLGSNVDRKVAILRWRRERKRMIWIDKNVNKEGEKKEEVILHDHHNNIKYISTYIVLNRYSVRITLQQNTNHFQMTVSGSIEDGKVAILRGRRERKRMIWVWETNKERKNSDRFIPHDHHNNIKYISNLPCSEQIQWKDHTPIKHEPLPDDRAVKQCG